MIVEQTNISMSSAYMQTQQYDKTETLSVTAGSGTPRPELSETNAGNTGDSVAISSEAMNAFSYDAARTSASDNEDLTLTGDAKLMIMKLIIEKLTGRKIDLKSIRGIIDAQSIRVEQDAGSTAQQQPAAPQQAVSVSYSSTETYSERQSMAYNANGVIKTADGKQISFSVELSLNSEFIKQNNINIQADNGVKHDPLVINFAGSAAQLSTDTIAFDLNGNGQTQNIHFTGAGSGFLVLDKNGDGKVNNGSELMGPTTGNGFSELAGYDSDNNGWIDENDPVYKNLSVWTKNADGGDKLTSLKALGIGAIDVSALSTTYAYKDKTNKLQGQLTSTGVFIRENGIPGTIQQIDLIT
ncbi:MAG: hypothetical protein L7F77_01910 [Candidatus Magnetominusculus sp. LBB02]|nr:hypothetical protein [Candidatus Magnetominusculus sp. LBB02]